jgi:hypothetical protein
LAADYGRAPDAALAAGWPCWTWVGPVALAVLLTAAKQMRICLVPCFIFGAALLPTLGWVPCNFQVVSTVADRSNYFTLLGPAVALSLFGALILASLLTCTAPRPLLYSGDVTLLPTRWR